MGTFSPLPVMDLWQRTQWDVEWNDSSSQVSSLPMGAVLNRRWTTSSKPQEICVEISGTLWFPKVFSYCNGCVCFEWIRMGCQNNNKCLVIYAELLDSIRKVCSCSDLQGYFFKLTMIDKWFLQKWLSCNNGKYKQRNTNTVKRDHVLR